MKKIILLLLIVFFCLKNVGAQSNNITKNVKDSLKILLQKEKQDTGRVMLLAQLSNAYANNKPDTAMLLALEALSLSKRIGFVSGEARSLGRIGLAYRVVGNLPKGLEAHINALKLEEKINNPRGIASNLDNIGTIYYAQGEYHQAIDNLLKAKKMFQQLNMKVGLAINLERIGNSYLGLKQYDSARVYAQQGFEIARKYNYHHTTGRTLSLMGEISSQTGQLKLAQEYYRLSIPYLKLSENNSILSDTFLGMSKLFESEGHMDSTLFYANEAYKINRGAGFTIGILDASRFLSSFYKTRGNSDSAYFYLEIATVTKDSLFSQQRINQLRNLDFDEKIRQMQIEEERKHNLQYAAIAIGLITFIILFFALSRSIIVKTKFIEFSGVLLLLAVFEFINLFIHPYLDKATNHSPVLMLLVLIVIGAMLVPLHHKLEKWITNIMVEKNKKIRLEAAKKTIATLEPG